jgi:hypothetical protein
MERRRRRDAKGDVLAAHWHRPRLKRGLAGA